MIEYRASFRKAVTGENPEIVVKVSRDEASLVEAVETIRSRIMGEVALAKVDLSAIPNGHFMEIEFLVGPDSVRGVAFTTPYLPAKFMAIVQDVLADVGIENVF